MLKELKKKIVRESILATMKFSLLSNVNFIEHAKI